MQFDSSVRAAAIAADLTANDCFPTAGNYYCDQARASLESRLNVLLLQLPTVTIVRVLLNAPPPSPPPIAPQPRPPPAPPALPPPPPPAPPSPPALPLGVSAAAVRAADDGDDAAWVAIVMVVIILGVALTAALFKIRLLNKRSRPAVARSGGGRGERGGGVRMARDCAKA